MNDPLQGAVTQAVAAVAAVYRISPQTLLGSGRNERQAEARYCVWSALHRAGWPQAEIARWWGVQPSSVQKGREKLRARANDPRVAEALLRADAALTAVEEQEESAALVVIGMAEAVEGIVHSARLAIVRMQEALDELELAALNTRRMARAHLDPATVTPIRRVS